MNIRIQRAVDSKYIKDRLAGASTLNLPEGFPLPVDSTGAPVEPLLGFLSERFLTRSTGRLIGYSLASATSAAYELADYWRYLQDKQKAWDAVDLCDIERYRDTMHGQISPKTEVEYSPATIAHRISTILSFYRWGASTERVALLTDAMPRLSQACGRTNGERPRYRSDKIIQLPTPDSEDAIRVLQVDEYRRIAARLGPLPSELDKDEGPTRDRLIVELALQTGLRRCEIAGLNINQILSLVPDPDKPYKVLPLRVVITKGGRPRTILIPSWLVQDLIWYVLNQRTKAAPLSRPVGSKLRSENALFVGHPWARQHAGHALQPGHFDYLYRRAVLGASLTRDVVKTDAVTGVERIAVEPRHVFHGVRHTFAVWTYYARKEAGDNEPWKYIQAALGHRCLDTTVNLYLRAAAAFEATVSDRLMKQMKIMRSSLNG